MWQEQYVIPRVEEALQSVSREQPQDAAAYGQLAVPRARQHLIGAQREPRTTSRQFTVLFARHRTLVCHASEKLSPKLQYIE